MAQRLTSLSDSALQRLTVETEDNITFLLDVAYLPSVLSWTFSITYLGVIIFRNNRIVESLDLLRQYQNQLPFGLLCITADGLDAYTITDFSSKRVKLFTLTAAERTTLYTTFYTPS